MKPDLRLFALFAVCAVLTACSVFGTPQPKTFDERLATGYTLVTQLRGTATVLVSNDIISADDAQQVQATADVGRVGLDVAARLGDSPAGNDRLTAVMLGLQGLQTYLAERTPR